LPAALKPKKVMPSWLSPICCSWSAAVLLASAFQAGASGVDRLAPGQEGGGDIATGHHDGVGRGRGHRAEAELAFGRRHVVVVVTAAARQAAQEGQRSDAKAADEQAAPARVGGDGALDDIGQAGVAAGIGNAVVVTDALGHAGLLLALGNPGSLVDDGDATVTFAHVA
jgi:hypothetical protein